MAVGPEMDRVPVMNVAPVMNVRPVMDWEPVMDGGHVMDGDSIGRPRPAAGAYCSANKVFCNSGCGFR